MTIRTSLVGGAALGVVLAATAAAGVQAKTVRHHHRAARADQGEASAAVRGEISELRTQVEALKTWRDSQATSQAQADAQLAQVKAQLADAQARVQATQARLDAQIDTIPGTVQTAVAAAAPKADKLYIKGVSVTLGGFVAAESVTRSRNEVADIASSFSAIPFGASTVGHTNETRLTARQSRISGLVQGDVSDSIHLAGYTEVDFLGAAQTANSNETNSYTPRMRVFYTTIDWDRDFGGLHLLAGQNWSLATMNTSGITPRTENPPLNIDAQYVPGFVFARQPQVRFTADIDKKIWFAVSLENPQTTYYNSGKFLPGVSVLTNGAAGSGYNSANTLSINRVPDVIGKVALQEDLGGHALHIEGFGIYRDFYARVNNGGNSGNESTSGGGVGGGVEFALLPKVLDLQASGIWGRGIGRYGASQLPDATLSVDGTLHPIDEWAALVGGTFHVNPNLDIYAYAGEERERQTAYTSGTIFNGVGNEGYDNTGCDTEGATNCVGNTRLVEQATVGFWDKPYIGRFGKIQWGVQYSYTERHAFDGKGAAPVTNDNMVFTSIRYYPF